MSSLNEALTDYLRIRRQLGFELKLAGRELESFVAFLEQEGAERITSELALPGAGEWSSSASRDSAGGVSQSLTVSDDGSPHARACSHQSAQ